MLVAVRKGEAGRLHMHGFAECWGMGDAERREWREMLEDLWRRRIPGTNEFEPLGTMNVDRLDMGKLLGKDGGNGTLGYLYGHKERIWVETSTLRRPAEQPPTTPGGAGSSCGPRAERWRTMPIGGASGSPAGNCRSAWCWSRESCTNRRAANGRTAGSGTNRNVM